MEKLVFSSFLFFLAPNETILINITLNMESAKLILLEKNIKEKDFYKCIEFKFPKPIHSSVSFTFEVVDKKKVLIAPFKSMTFIQTDKPIYKPGQTGTMTETPKEQAARKQKDNKEWKAKVCLKGGLLEEVNDKNQINYWLSEFGKMRINFLHKFSFCKSLILISFMI
uniref:Uncharacterized protein n=1 Tax=Erpetoichthys calabaricus TaxID=27687 RepID=A0A8C4SXV5_ERPCA